MWETSATMATEQTPLQHQIMPSGTGTKKTSRDIVEVLQSKPCVDQGKYKTTRVSHNVPLPRAQNHVQFQWLGGAIQQLAEIQEEMVDGGKGSGEEGGTNQSVINDV